MNEITMPRPALPRFLRATRACCGALLLAATAGPALATYIDPATPVPTQLLNFGPLQGDAFLPLTSADKTSKEAGAPAATGDGYGWVNSHIVVTLSSQRTPTPGAPSTGDARFGLPFGGGCSGGGVAGTAMSGDVVCVTSLFDLIFDLQVTNIDSTANYFGDSTAPQVLSAMDRLMPLAQQGTCIADPSRPNLGCLPPQGSSFTGFLAVTLDLLRDVNGNGHDDAIDFGFYEFAVGSVTNSFMQGADVVDTYGSGFRCLGSVYDSNEDPPFTCTLDGPTTARQGIVYGTSVPEPAGLALVGVGLAGIGLSRWRKPERRPAWRNRAFRARRVEPPDATPAG